MEERRKKLSDPNNYSTVEEYKQEMEKYTHDLFYGKDAMKYQLEYAKKAREKREQEGDNLKKIIYGEPPKTDNAQSSNVYKKQNNYDHPDTMENGSAIILYVFTILIGSIFNDRITIWVCATIILLLHLCRHKFRR